MCAFVFVTAHAGGFGKIGFEHLRDIVGEARVGGHDHQLEVQAERTVVQVGAAHGSGLVVDQHDLLMQEAGQVAVDLHARANRLIRIQRGGQEHHVVVRPRWDQDAHVHPAQHRQAQRGKHGFVRNEVRRRDPQPLARRLNGLHEEQRAGFLLVGRAAGDHLANHVFFGAQLGHDQLRHFAGSPVPVFGKGELQVHHGGTDDLDMRVAPRCKRRLFAHVFVADVVAAHVSALAVHHHELAVVAEIELEAVDEPGMGGERLGVYAAFNEPLHIAAR